MAVHKFMDDNESRVSEYYEEPASSDSSEGRKTWLAIPFCRYMASFKNMIYRKCRIQ